jgi:hypothetical protein
MALTLNSEKSLLDFMNLGLTPEPIPIVKGNYYAITNYTYGENLIFVTEDQDAPAFFYSSIYSNMLVENLIIGVGVTLTLTQDIFISGKLNNFGTIVGGTVYEIDQPTILNNMAYSWESDLGITEISGGVDSWVDNISGVSLDAPSPSQRPTYLASDVNFNGRPSLKGDTATTKKLTSNTNLILNSSEMSVFIVVRGVSQSTTDRILEYGEGTNFLLASRRTDDLLQTQAIGNVGSSVSRSGALVDNQTSTALFTWDIGAAPETKCYLDGVEGSQVSSSVNTLNLTNGVFDVFSNGAGSSLFDGQIVSVLVYKDMKTGAALTEIENYLSNKYI